MNEIQIKVTGGKAVILILILVTIAGFQYFRLQTTVEGKAKEAVQIELLAEYAGKSNVLLKEARQQDVTLERVSEVLEQVQNLQKIEITSIKGRKSGKDVIVRVKFTIDGRSLTDGANIRYYVMKKDVMGKWQVKRRTSALWYYAALW